MANNSVRISKILKEFNIGIATVVEFLKKKGIEVEANPNDKISDEAYGFVMKEFGKEQDLKEASKKIIIKPIRESAISVSDVKPVNNFSEEEDDYEEEVIIKSNTVDIATEVKDLQGPKIVGKLSMEEIQGKRKKEEVLVVKKESPVVANQEQVTEAKNVKEEIPVVETTKQNEVIVPKQEEVITAKQHVGELKGPKIIEKIDIKSIEKPRGDPNAVVSEAPISKAEVKPMEVVSSSSTQVVSEVEAAPDDKLSEPEFIATKVEQLSGPNVVGKIDLKQFEVKKIESRDAKKKRQRIRKDGKINVAAEIGVKREHKKLVSPANVTQQQQQTQQQTQQPVAKPSSPPKELKKRDKLKPIRQQVDDDAVQRQVKDTLARLTATKGKTKSSKYRRDKRDAVNLRNIEEQERQLEESNILRVTEFVTVNELATMMDVLVIKVIEACMNLGLMVSINQRLDAEALVLVAEEFGYAIEFVTADLQDSIEVEEDKEEDLVPRSPIITVMGHVDHGKTSLLDYIRKANVIEGEAGGITQHIGAYSVKMPDGRKITFLDTPGHEAFTAMRARGAKVTDLVIIIIAADDAVMPQTVEAINHAVAAGVPMIFAINKIDKPGANSEKIREQLANMNYLLEDWGGKYQSQEIAAKQGLNVDKLLEKVLLEADMLELKANPNKRALGTVIESSLDKGRGFMTTLLVQSGTLKIGDILLSGSFTGRVKAMFNERGQRIEKAGPSMPALVLGLNGAPTAGETFNVMEGEKEAREIASKREQLIRMQGLRTKKHITLDEIGRRIAIGSFKELNIILKGDVDGSIEALSDSLIKLSTEEVQVNVIHKAVGAISESDVLLAAASNAIIVGFQVRPSMSARKLAEKEEIEIRLYSVIYDAINEVKDGIEGMLAPEMKEEITSTVEVMDVFKITKVGSVAGCMVREGKITRNSRIRVIRDGIVVHTGTLGSLKRFKDDVKEVSSGYECGLNIDNYNDIKIGDMVESYEMVEVKRKL